MKESMSVTYIFQFVILFILLFTAIMALTINNSNAFGVKDKIVSIIEQNNGNYTEGDGSLSEEIIELLKSTSYRTTGKCPTDSDNNYVGFDQNGNMVSSDQKASICIKKVSATGGIDKYLTEEFEKYGIGDKIVTGDFIPGYYYQVVVFYQLDLPVVEQVYNISSKAETKVLYSK